jgi:hypothetical protein
MTISTCPHCSVEGLPERAEPLFHPVATTAVGLQRWTMPVVCGHCGAVYCKRNLAPEEKADFERLANEAAEEGDPDVMALAGRALEGEPRSARIAGDIVRKFRADGREGWSER